MEPLQDFKNSQYERPNQTWFESSIESTASETGQGVYKQRSLRSKRRIFTVACTLFTAGAILILFNSPYRNNIVKPGELSSPHAQILANHGANKCAACHEAGNLSFSEWVTDAFSGGKVASKCQSDLCMQCHEKTIPKEFAMNPHNVAKSVLAETTKRFQQVSFKKKIGLKPPVIGNEIACSACHREHHGEKDLAALTDQQCQSCHSGTYHSFETDHPEFENWPVSRRGRIAFDHTSHGLKHFPGKKLEFNCNECHIDDAYRNVKRLAPYENSCAKCHDDSLRASGEDGLALFALPILDLEAFKEYGLDVGTWPENATGDFDGELPPIMRVLLSADPDAAQILAEFGSDFDFSDIDPADTIQVQKASKLTWSIKNLLNELSIDGVRAIRSRLEAATGEKIAEAQLASMALELNEPVFQEAVQRWLPGLNVEVTNRKFGSTSKISWLPESPLYFREAYSDELLAPNPLKGLLTPSIESKVTNTPAATETPMTTETRPAEISATQSPASPSVATTNKSSAHLPTQGDFEPQNQPGIPTTPETINQIPDAELLTVNPLKNQIGIRGQVAVTPNTTTPDVSMNLTHDQPQTAGQEGDPATLPTETVNDPAEQWTPPSTDHVAKNNPAFEVIRSVVPVATRSGWFRDDAMFQVSYRPRGHADECLKSWTDWVTNLENGDERVETAALFSKMTSQTGVGMCRSCHTVDQLEDESFAVNWEPAYRDVSKRPFTRFSHGPHLVQPLLRDCSHCHEMDENRPNAESFVSFDSNVAISNFRAVKKENCTSCHREGQTDNSCTQCHNYHIGSQVIGTKHQ